MGKERVVPGGLKGNVAPQRDIDLEQQTNREAFDFGTGLEIGQIKFFMS
jgi:hypothetical protein